MVDRASIVIGVCSSVVLISAPAAAKDLSWTLKLEAGSEYDSNVFRLERPEGQAVDIESAPLARLGTRFALGYRPWRGEKLDFRGFLGTKLFTTEEAQSENVAVASVDGGYSWALRSRPVVLGLRGSHYNAENYEAFGEGRPVAGRTFATSGVEATTTLIGRPGHSVRLGAGYRNFDYKPDPDFDWHGLSLSAGYRGSIWLGEPEVEPDVASVDVTVRYRLDRRDYRGLAFRNQCGPQEALEPRCSIPTDGGRHDLMHIALAELAYTGERLYSLRYQAQVNDSNSFTQSFVRHRVDVGMTTELIADIFLTARGTLQFNVFLDSLLITQDVNSQTFVSIDDENRNSLSLVLSKDLSDAVTAEARYVIYSNEFATRELDFRRQTAYFGFVYRTGS